MNWLTFAILATIGLVLQTTLAPFVAVGGIRPDWMFVLCVFYALFGPWPDACIAAWILGLLVDLSSVYSRVGLFAFAFGGTAWLIFRSRELVFREHWLAHTLFVLIGGLAVQTIAAVYRWAAAPPGPGPAMGYWSPAVLTSLYTAFWAPYFHWMLFRLRRVTGLRTAAGR